MNPVIQNILSRLQGVKKDGRGWKALCPAHNDRKPSLKIDEAKDGKILLKCFAGCETEDIVKAIGLEVGDLFPGHHKKPPRKQRQVVATYNYTDENGVLLFQVCRTADKRFFQRRPDGKGGWVNGLGDVKPVLYRLPELLQAVQRSETVFIPEGEKDVDNLARLGLAATTSPMGAGKWRDYYSEWLKGANCVILPDNDESGRKHAKKVAESLQGKAKSIKVVKLPDLPDKGDVSDWLAAGGTKAALLEIVRQAPEYGKKRINPIVTCLADVEPEEVTWLWEPYIPFGKLTILEGDPGIGKTWLALQIAAAVTNGDPFPDTGDGIPRTRREPANVVYMTAEDGLGDTLRPRLDKAGADVSRVFALQGWTSTDPETGEETKGGISLQHIPVLEQALEQYKPALLVVDPLQAYLGADVDMHRANEVRPVLSGLASLAEKYGVAVLLIRHLGKSQQDRAIYRGLGSIDFAAAARSILLAGQNPQQPKERALIQTKNSLAALGPAIAYELRDGQFFWSGLSELTAASVFAPEIPNETSALDEAKEFLLSLLGDGPVAAKEIAKQRRDAGISERTLNRAKAELKVKSFKNGATWYWALKEDCQVGDNYQVAPKNIFVGNLGNVPESLATQGIAGINQDCHMANLNEKDQTLGAQGFEGSLPTLPKKNSHSESASERTERWEVLET